MARAGGSKLNSVYHDGVQEVAPVPVMDIKDAAASATEETVLSTGGTFLASGAVWLGVERLATEGIRDQLFGICVVAVIAGLILSWVGHRQQSRRVKRLERYCPKETKSAEQSTKPKD